MTIIILGIVAGSRVMDQVRSLALAKWDGFNWQLLAVAVIGAIVVLLIYRKIKAKRRIQR